MTVSYFEIANQLKQEGKLEEAIAAYHQAIEQKPKFYCSYHNLGDTLSKLHRWDEAASAYRCAIELNPNSAWSIIKLGEVLVKTGDVAGAIESYLSAIKLNPDFKGFYTSLVNLLIAQNKLSEGATKVYSLKFNFIKNYITVVDSLKQTQLQNSEASQLTLNSDFVKICVVLIKSLENLVQIKSYPVEYDNEKNTGCDRKPAVNILKTQPELISEKQNIFLLQCNSAETHFHITKLLNRICYLTAEIANFQGVQSVYSDRNLDETFCEVTGSFNNEAFVQAVYCFYLKRPADDSGKNHWLSELENITLTRLQLLFEFRQTPEFYNLFKRDRHLPLLILLRNFIFVYLQKPLADLRQMVELFPHFYQSKELLAEVYCYVGEGLESNNQLQEAIACYQEAIALNPNFALAYIRLGESLVKQGQLHEGIERYEKAIALKADWEEVSYKMVETYMKISWISLANGQFQESISTTQKAIEIYSHLVEINPLGNLGLRFFTPEYFTNWPWLWAIGHLAMNIDIYVKMGILGWQSPRQTILIAPLEQVVNPCLLNYWRGYLCIISDQELIEKITPLAKNLRCLEHTLYYTKFPNGQITDMSYALLEIQKKWETEGRAPLLTLSLEDYERGWKCLQELGISKDSWFVALHIREDGFWNNSGSYYRNADINTYFLAIETIVSHGGWVIRVGDPTMKPLSPLKQVIDYVHTDLKSDWMDIFLSTQCHFFLGTASGLTAVPWVFGTPCALTNIWPMSMRSVSIKDLFIPKLNFLEKEGRYLTFKEAQAPDLFFNINSQMVSSWGIKVENNTPEDINELVLEMLSKLEGTIKYTEEDEALQKKFKSLPTPYGTNPANCRIGREFLRKYARLL